MFQVVDIVQRSRPFPKVLESTTSVFFDFNRLRQHHPIDHHSRVSQQQKKKKQENQARARGGQGQGLVHRVITRVGHTNQGR